MRISGKIFLIFLVGICIVALLVVFLYERINKTPSVETSAQSSLLTTENATIAPGNTTENVILQVFTIEHKSYYMMKNGELRHYDGETDSLIYTFPTNNIFWSELLTTFVYYDQASLYFLNPFENETPAIIFLEEKLPLKDEIFVSFVSQNAVYLNGSSQCWKVDLTDYSVTVADFPSAMCYHADREFAVVCIFGARNELYLVNLKTDEAQRIVKDTSGDPIIDACIWNGKVYYTCYSSGTLKHSNLDIGLTATPPSGVAETVDYSVFPESSEKICRISALYPTNHALICVVQAGQYPDESVFGVMKISQDGTVQCVCDLQPHSVMYFPGVCVLAADETWYTYAFQTSSMRVYAAYSAD